MVIDPKTDPTTRSRAYTAMAPVWDKIDTVLGGTKAMRVAGTLYLPQHQEESDLAYAERLLCSTLLNEAELTLNSWVGRPFSEPVKIGSDVPKEIKDLFDDIDLQGNQLSVFARNWFREGLAKSVSHVLVDFPSVDRVGRTVANDLKENLRPYWTFVRPENLIFASSDIINGHEVLTHVRIREQSLVRVGFSEKLVDRIRIFERDDAGQVTCSLWELKDKSWKAIQSPALLDIDEIPIVTFYSDRMGLMLGKPPLEDLVDLNIAHWQSSSDQRSILTVARFPILACSGVDEDESEGKKKMPLGPRKVLTTPDPSGKWYYVEHQGNAIAAGRQDLQDLEEKMGHYGAEFLTKRPGSTTATARALDSVESTSGLQDAVIRFNDALNQALVLTGKWIGVEKPGQVLINTEFIPAAGDQADLSALANARTSKDISRKTYVHELQRRGTLAEDFDEEVDLEELDSEDTLGAPVTPGPIDPLAQDQQAPPEGAPSPPLPPKK